MHAILTLFCCVACAKGPPAEGNESTASTANGAIALTGAVLAGGEIVDIELSNGLITAVAPGGDGTVPSSADVTVYDLSGKWLSPAFIDSHVHLAYLPEPDEMAAGGVAGVVDMAAPLSFLGASHPPLRLIASGPMVTAVGGYPTQSWGEDGYGLECADAAAAEAAVSDLVARGARLIKLPITSAPVLDADALAAAAARAHTLGVKVASHALSDDQAAAARVAGVDVLAHTPTEALSDATVSAWADGAVISSLRAFGGRATTVENLSRLVAAGATVMYGTDFGNTRTTGIDGDELALMQQAGLGGAAILAAGTSTPARYWGFDGLGEIAVGARASLLVLNADPLVDPLTLASPDQVWIDGDRQ